MPVLAFAALVLGIIAAATAGDAWWLLAGVIGFVFLGVQPN